MMTLSDSRMPIVGTGTVNNAKCVDDANSGTKDGNPIQLYPCNGTGAQRWTLGTDETVRVFGKCLDVTSGATAAGMKVQLYTCNGTGAQRWRVESNGTLVNPQSNRCLYAASSTTGTRLEINDCAAAKLSGATWEMPAVRGLVGRWSLHEGSGDTGQDAADGRLRTLTCTAGVTWAASPDHGTAVRLGGTSQSCDALDPVVWTAAGFSVAAWMSLRATPGSATRTSRTGFSAGPAPTSPA